MESRVGANNYRVTMGSKAKTYHVNMLKKYIARKPEDVVSASIKDDATVTAANVIHQDTDPELEEVLDFEGFRICIQICLKNSCDSAQSKADR